MASTHEAVLGRYFVLGLADALSKGLGFLATIALGRSLGPTPFGEINFAQSVVLFAFMVATAGLDVVAVRRAAQSEAPVGETASTVIVLRLLLGAAVYALLLVVAFAVPALRAVWSLIALFGLTLFSGALSLAWVPQAVQRTHVLGMANIASQGTYLALVLVGLHAGAGAWIAPVAFVAGEAAAAAGLLVWMQRTQGGLLAPMSGDKSRRMLVEASPIGGAQLLRAVSQGSDLIIAGILLPMAAVGWYGGAYKLYLLGVTTIALYMVIVFPRFSAAAAQPGLLRLELRASALRVALLGLAGVAIGIAFAPALLRLLFDPSFEAGATSLRLLVGSLLLYVANAHIRSALVALGRQTTDLQLVAGSAAVHLAAKTGLAAAFGIEGLALGMIAGEIAYFVPATRVLVRAMRKS